MALFQKKADYGSLFSKYLDPDFTAYFCGDENKPAIDSVKSAGKSLNIDFPRDFLQYSTSKYGGVYVEVKESIWPRPQPYDVASFWTFLYGFFVSSFSNEAPNWMDFHTQGLAFKAETRSNFVPFLKIVGDADVFCFGPDGGVHRWSHETGEFTEYENTFDQILEIQLMELSERKKKRIEG